MYISLFGVIVFFLMVLVLSSLFGVEICCKSSDVYTSLLGVIVFLNVPGLSSLVEVKICFKGSRSIFRAVWVKSMLFKVPGLSSLVGVKICSLRVPDVSSLV